LYDPNNASNNDNLKVLGKATTLVVISSAFYGIAWSYSKHQYFGWVFALVDSLKNIGGTMVIAG